MCKGERGKEACESRYSPYASVVKSGSKEICSYDGHNRNMADRIVVSSERRSEVETVTRKDESELLNTNSPQKRPEVV